MVWVEAFCLKGSLEFILLIIHNGATDWNKVSKGDGACADWTLVGRLMFC